MPRTAPPPFPPAAARPLAARAAAWFRSSRLFGRAGAADAPPDSSAGPSGRRLPQVSDYERQHVIARNERSTVYRAVETATGETVALKIVHLGAASAAEGGLWREHFLREAAAAAMLRHENIVRVRAGGVQGEGGALDGWLAMEWVHGTDLARYATRARLLPEHSVLGLMQRVALALDFAHRSGVVHRDVKPSNVLFDPASGAAKVTDFGSVRIVDSAATRSGIIVGSPAYMAPEQLAGEEATPQGDLYSLGVTLFELLAGRRPFEADSMGELLARVARESPPRLRSLRPELPPLLDDIVGRLLAKAPALRQASGHQVALELRLAASQCAAAPPADPGRTGDRAIQGTIGR
jgi:serine/threonine-protein kinase